eukprot:GHVT01065856.1.p1 GENE.GHVT01065856.1~~GHVT01065856.1.p1  ORF type:complete len:112 (-),score=21.48 GHVT01065856.1:440-775(-)
MEESEFFDLHQLAGLAMNFKSLRVDWSPLSVLPNTPLTRIQYMFTMLSLGQLFVCGIDGHLLGVITKPSFLGLSEDDPTLTTGAEESFDFQAIKEDVLVKLAPSCACELDP